MATEVEPEELNRLLGYAERSRVGDWSLRSALCRYAQPRPGKVRDVLELVRRIDFALHPHTRRLSSEGPALWAAVRADRSGAPDQLVGLLAAMVELDRLGDVLAGWAADRSGGAPDAAVDAAIAAVAERLDRLGVPHEERERPPRSRG